MERVREKERGGREKERGGRERQTELLIGHKLFNSTYTNSFTLLNLSFP